MTDKIKQIVQAVKELPPFPKVAQRLLLLLDDKDVAASELSEVVQLDPALTANALKIVNSAMYSLPRKVDNINQALALLGNRKFAEVVLASSTAGVLSDSMPGYDMDRGDLWKHSLATALATQVLSEMVGLTPGPALYTAALMHDIGKVVMSTFIQDEIPFILERVEKGESFLVAEKEVLGLHHGQLGGLIAKVWQFSPEMVMLIANHHEPEKNKDSKELSILYLSDLLVKMMGLGGGVDGLAYWGRSSAAERLGLKEANLEVAMAELHIRLSKAESLVDTND